jgi:hypothetical protein
MDLERLSNLAGSAALNAQRHSMKALGHMRLLVFDGFLAKLKQ